MAKVIIISPWPNNGRLNLVHCCSLSIACQCCSVIISMVCVPRIYQATV